MEKKRHTHLDISPSEPSLKKHSKPNINPYTKQPYSKQYYEILEKRKKLPAWEAKEQLIMLLETQ